MAHGVLAGSGAAAALPAAHPPRPRLRSTPVARAGAEAPSRFAQIVFDRDAMLVRVGSPRFAPYPIMPE